LTARLRFCRSWAATARAAALAIVLVSSAHVFDVQIDLGPLSVRSGDH
jgi:hypothetical protein